MSSLRFGTDQFYLESYVDSYLPNISQMAIGYFNISIGGRVFGVRKNDATLLACSYDAVLRRLKGRNAHTLSFGETFPPNVFVAALLRSHLGDLSHGLLLSDEEFEEFRAKLFSNDIFWAPDGDAAFDDGSYVIQIDCKDIVRVIGFTYGKSRNETLASVSEVWIESDDFYAVLEKWSKCFLAEWESHTGPGLSSH